MPRKYPKLRVTQIQLDDDAPVELPEPEYYSELEDEAGPANCLYRLSNALLRYKNYTFDLGDMRILIDILNTQLRRMADAPDYQERL